MSAESVAQQQCQDTKAVAKDGAKLLTNVLKEIRLGLDPNKAMDDIMNASSDKLSLKISEMEKSGLLTDKEADAIRQEVRPLNSYKDLEDGCYKSASMDHITEKLENFKAGDSKEELMKGIKDSVKAPDSIRMQTKGSPDFEVLKANIHIKAEKNGTLLHKETLNISRRQMRQEMIKANKNGTRVASKAVKTAGKTAGKAAGKGAATVAKGAATTALGASTCGIGFIVSAVKEIVTAAGRAFAKTTGLAKGTGINRNMERSR